MRFVYRHLNPEEAPVLEPGDERPMSPLRSRARQVVPFFSDLFDEHGLITVVKQGWALGAYREGGAIGHDGDGDVFIIQPSCYSLADLRRFLSERVAEWNTRPGVPQLKLNTIHPWVQQIVYVDFGQASLDAHFSDGHVFGVDISFLHERSLLEDEDYNRFCQKQDGLRPDHLFRSLKVCRFEGLRLCSFDDAAMRDYLEHLYGADYMTPQERLGREIHLRNRRPIWRSGPGGHLFDLIDEYNVAFDIFERHRLPRFRKDS